MQALIGRYDGTPTHFKENCRLIVTHGVSALSSRDCYTLEVQSGASWGASWLVSFDQTPVVQAVVRTMNALLKEMESRPPMKKPIWFFTIKNGNQFETRAYSSVFAAVQRYLDAKPKLSSEAHDRLTSTLQRAKRVFEEIDFALSYKNQIMQHPERNWLNDYVRSRVFVVGERDFKITEDGHAAEAILGHIQAELNLGWLQGKILGDRISVENVLSGDWWRAKTAGK